MVDFYIIDDQMNWNAFSSETVFLKNTHAIKEHIGSDKRD